jgi:hypothetical protein
MFALKYFKIIFTNSDINKLIINTSLYSYYSKNSWNSLHEQNYLLFIIIMLYVLLFSSIKNKVYKNILNINLFIYFYILLLLLYTFIYFQHIIIFIFYLIKRYNSFIIFECLMCIFLYSNHQLILAHFLNHGPIFDIIYKKVE